MDSIILVVGLTSYVCGTLLCRDILMILLPGQIAPHGYPIVIIALGARIVKQNRWHCMAIVSYSRGQRTQVLLPLLGENVLQDEILWGC